MCIQLDGLEPFRDVTVGLLSIEKPQRMTIAVELAVKVSSMHLQIYLKVIQCLCYSPKFLLFLDEPTSGLDSQSTLGSYAFPP